MDKDPLPLQPEPRSNKRWLLITGFVVLVAIVGAAWFCVIVLLRPPPNNASGNSSTNPETADTNQNRSCSITASAAEGPYYVTDAPALVAGNLNYTNLPGKAIKIIGHAYGGEETGIPLANAKIDIWQTDSDGKYHPQGNGPANRYDPAQVALRGYVLTDQTGAYEFTSIYPGEYEDRARHIHARVTADGYNGVTTQLIVPKGGDKTPPAKDSIAKNLPSCHTLTFQNDTATFDFHLQ
jgi:protocatechuate 3,4-dioxygenase beta subunit